MKERIRKLVEGLEREKRKEKNRIKLRRKKKCKKNKIMKRKKMIEK